MAPRPRRTFALLAAFALSLLAAGCGGGGTDGSSDGASAKGTASGSSGWLSIPITDVDGETFTIESLKGRPVFVENFATWCSNCRKQLGKTQEAAAAAGDDAVFVALSVETDLDADQVREYARDEGFTDIRFAVMSPDLLAAMDDAYGKSALNPPSTPKIVVAADGTPGAMKTGFEEPDQIAASIAAS